MTNARVFFSADCGLAAEPTRAATAATAISSFLNDRPPSRGEGHTPTQKGQVSVVRRSRSINGGGIVGGTDASENLVSSSFNIYGDVLLKLKDQLNSSNTIGQFV